MEYFRFSIHKETKNLLLPWFEWFKASDIPCCITSGPKGYSVWRAGKEAVDPETANVIRGKEVITKGMKIVEKYRWPE